jgi:hypothetical protein
LIGLYPLRSLTLSENQTQVSSALDTFPTINANLPNTLLPLPTYNAPAFIFNTTGFHSSVINETSYIYTSTNSIPAPSAGLASQKYTPLPLQADATGTISTISSGETPLPTAGPLNSSVIAGLASARSSVFAQATATWQNGIGKSSGARRNGVSRVEGTVAVVSFFGSFVWTLS